MCEYYQPCCGSDLLMWLCTVKRRTHFMRIRGKDQLDAHLQYAKMMLL